MSGETGLERTTPESQGIASSAILRFVEAAERELHDLHSFMLLRHGKVIAEGWWSPYERDSAHMLFSLSKSFTSTAVGLAISEGCFSLDDPVLSFFPDERPASVNEHLAAMRVRHLLSMTTGHEQDTMPAIDARQDGNWIKGFFDVPVVFEPGSHFLYNTGATYLLSAIVQKTTTLKLVDYLEPRLFKPLGIDRAVWQESPQNINTGGFGLSLKTEDVARFGQLYLQLGKWGNDVLVPEAWVKEATSYQTPNGDNLESDWAQGYGYQFWRCRHGAYRGDGAFGQYCVVMPEQDAVLVITAGLADMQQPLNLVWEQLLPAMQTDALPPDAIAQAALSEKLARLSIQPIGNSIPSPTPVQTANQSYKFEANELKLERIGFTFTPSSCTVRFTTAELEENITCGNGAWHEGQSMLLKGPRDSEPMRIVASGGWTAQDTFTMVVRLVQTPFYNSFVYRFSEKQLTLETRVNVGFKPPQTTVLVGTPI